MAKKANDRIIDKIKKLIRHEQSARQCSTPEEAAAFAGKIRQLLIDHKISVDQVRIDDEPEAKVGEERVAAGRAIRYGSGVSVPRADSCLMRVVAEAHFCQAISIPQSNTILIVGAEEDRAVAVEMFRFLVSTMKRFARVEEEKARRARKSIRKFKPFFYRGFTVAVDRRYDKMRSAVDSTSTALIRADALVKRYVEANYETVSKQPRKAARINKNAYFSGVLAGSHVDLGTNALGGSAHVDDIVAR